MTMGLVVDRSQDNLGPADRAIIAARRLLLQAITTVQDGGDPPGVDASYYHARAIEKIFPRSSTWRETGLPEMYADGGSLAAGDWGRETSRMASPLLGSGPVHHPPFEP